MAGQFDATLKQLLDACAPDWLAWLAPHVGLPTSIAADPLERYNIPLRLRPMKDDWDMHVTWDPQTQSEPHASPR